MLRPDGQPERVRKGRPWWLLLLVPPVALVAWFFVGMEVAWQGWYLETEWIKQPSPPITEPQLDQGLFEIPNGRQNLVPIGDRLFTVVYFWPANRDIGIQKGSGSSDR